MIFRVLKRPTLAITAFVYLCLTLPANAAGSQGQQGTRAAGSPDSPAQNGPARAVSIETQDPALAKALALVTAEPTAEHLVAAAYRYQELGIRDKAMQLFSHALSIDSKYALAYDGRARIWRDWGHLDEALGDATRATYIAPENAVTWNTMGTILQVAQRRRDARAAFTRSVALNPAAPHAWNNLCYLSFLEARVEDAVLECSCALATDPGFSAAFNNLALAHATLGNLDRAFELFRAAGGEAHAHYNLGLIRLTQKNYSAAIEAFDAASRADPAFEAARKRAREARRLARIQGNPSDARD